MARYAKRGLTAASFADEGDTPEPEGDQAPEETPPAELIPNDDDAGVAGDEPLPEPKASEAESEAGSADAPPAPTAPPQEAPPSAETASVEKPTNEIPPALWPKFKEYEKQAEELQRRQAEWQQKEAELAQLRQWQQQLWLQQQAREQQAQHAQGVPGVTRPYTQEELNALREADPLSYNQYVAESALQQNQRLQQQFMEQQEYIRVQQDTESFRRQQPDYDDSLRFLEKHEVASARAMGMNDQQTAEYVQFRASQLVQIAKNLGKTVPQAAYAIAREWGYTPAQAQAAAQAVDAPSTPSTPSATPQQRVQASIQRSQIAAASIGPSGGSVAPPGRVTRAEYDAADGRQLDAWDKMYGEGWEDTDVLES